MFLILIKHNLTSTSVCTPVLKHVHYSSLKKTAVSRLRSKIFVEVLSCGLTVVL